MRRITLIATAAAIAMAGAGSATSARAGATGGEAAGRRATLCVGGKHCYPTLQAAVKAAHRGDTIRIGRGRFKGGVRIHVSVNLVGAGARRTIIHGGGPVLTIGTIGNRTEPTVSIRGVTITGGVATTSPESRPFVRADHVIAAGGGVEVPPRAGRFLGATVTISNSVISNNRAAPTASSAIGPPCPGDVQCPFAGAWGGGIDTWGKLTLEHTVVSGNEVAGDASDAEGAGILGHLGTVKIINSTITRNRAVASAPNGRYADGGGVFVEGGSLTMKNTHVTSNSVSLTTAMADSVDTHAAGAGVHIAGDDDCVQASKCVAATIQNSLVTGNSVTSTNSGGGAAGFCGGICSDGILTLSGSTSSNNSVLVSSTEGSASGDSGGLGLGGPAKITSSHFTGNTVTAKAPNGTATAQAGGISTGDTDILTTIGTGVISGNEVSASSDNGQAVVFGAGLSNGGLLAITSANVADNNGSATGPTGYARGGGIWNSAFGSLPPEPPFGTLTLTGSVVGGNALVVHGGITPLGGGLYTDGSATLNGDHITGNSPGNCSGVSC
jgi:hypothetical protein